MPTPEERYRLRDTSKEPAHKPYTPHLRTSELRQNAREPESYAQGAHTAGQEVRENPHIPEGYPQRLRELEDRARHGAVTHESEIHANFGAGDDAATAALLDIAYRATDPSTGKLRIKNLTRFHLEPQRFPVHGAPATGEPVFSNGVLGADVLYVPPFGQFPLHTHPGNHLLYCLEGEGTVTYGGEVYIITPGDIYFIDAAVPHAVGAGAAGHLLVAFGAPHKRVNAKDRMTLVTEEEPHEHDHEHGILSDPDEVKRVYASTAPGSTTTSVPHVVRIAPYDLPLPVSGVRPRPRPGRRWLGLVDAVEAEALTAFLRATDALSRLLSHLP